MLKNRNRFNTKPVDIFTDSSGFNLRVTQAGTRAMTQAWTRAGTRAWRRVLQSMLIFLHIWSQSQFESHSHRLVAHWISAVHLNYSRKPQQFDEMHRHDFQILSRGLSLIKNDCRFQLALDISFFSNC